MKLRTTLIDVETGKYAGGEEHDADHDLLAAHAMRQAIVEWWDRPPKNDSCTDAAVTWIECRADELMREWTGEPTDRCTPEKPE